MNHSICVDITFVLFVLVLVTMNNNIQPVQGLSVVTRPGSSGFFCRQRKSVVSSSRRMMMMDETNTKSIIAPDHQHQQQAKSDSTSTTSNTLATLYRQEMIDLEHEIFFLEEDIMHIVHKRKEILHRFFLLEGRSDEEFIMNTI